MATSIQILVAKSLAPRKTHGESRLIGWPFSEGPPWASLPPPSWALQAWPRSAPVKCCVPSPVCGGHNDRLGGSSGQVVLGPPVASPCLADLASFALAADKESHPSPCALHWRLHRSPGLDLGPAWVHFTTLSFNGTSGGGALYATPVPCSTETHCCTYCSQISPGPSRTTF